ncbi:MAG: hypothetical protein CMH57_08935 [Myxococcales bacterium]|nr:hypothetical protein [Myxococcales bacterium]
MGETQDTLLTEQMASLLTVMWLQEQAHQLGVVKRQRLVHITDFVWTLIVAFGTGKDTTLTALCSTFNLHTGLDLAQSSFNKRFTPQMATLMATSVTHLLQTARESLPRFDSKWLDYFSNLTAIDATIIRVHDSLRSLWPSCTAGQAAIKLHAVHNVTHAMPHKFQLSAGTLHDSKPWRRLGAWVKGHLLLFDLGYYNFNFFARLQAKGALFVTRAKSDFNPVILKVHGKTRGQAMEVEGKRLAEVLPRLRRKVLDAEVEVTHKTRKYKEKQRTKTMRLRLVMVYNEETGQYHRYLCNLDPQIQDGLMVAALYGLRWEVELLFKALKSSSGGLVKVPGKRACVVECLVWASIAKLLISRIMLRRVRKQRGVLERHIPENRWDKRLCDIASQLLNALVQRRRAASADPLMDFLLRTAPDPNRHRRTPLDSLALC